MPTNMPTYRSPWLAQLNHERPHFLLERNAECDIAVVGAGIAGLSTTYFLLKHTKATVVLVEAGRIAHGATGHNAGQLVSYFERQLPELAAQFGEELAIQAQTQVESAWGLLDDMIADCRPAAPLYRCQGYSGWCTIEQIIRRLRDKQLRHKYGLTHEPLLVMLDPKILQQIPSELSTFVLPVPHSVILDALMTDDASFIAADSEPKGCLNGALFCEQLAAALLVRYGDRLTIAEHLPVTDVILRGADADLLTTGPQITAKRVVLCTNGFENFRIANLDGEPVDPAFHTMVEGVIGYMSGYTEPRRTSVAAVSYVRGDKASDAYHYLTRRPAGDHDSLLCLGGPERLLPAGAIYERESPFPADIEEELERALVGVYRDRYPQAKRTFLWHGLMGYTPNGLRRIGYEPRNRVLLYNLGCNGVGILPSIYGGRRIAQLLAGQELPDSLFDPQ